MSMSSDTSKNTDAGFQFIEFDKIEGTSCPCGVAKRGLMNEERVPFSLHVTEISEDARAHYHKRITETYFIVDCADDAQIELDGKLFPLTQNTAVVIHPGTRHRAIGKMKIINIASPKFDPSDEWFD